MSRLRSNLTKKILSNCDALKNWYDHHLKEAEPAFYSSVDIRDSGDKIVPVDSNLYPGGFNNVCPADQLSGQFIFKAQIAHLRESLNIQSIQKILVLPERHTKNTHYIDNLEALTRMISDGGFTIEIGWLPDPDSAENSSDAISLSASDGKVLKAHPITVSNDGILSVKNFVPDLILLNNDFSSGYPKLLDGVKQPVLPSHRLGWHSRKKSDHFSHYNRLAKEFSELIGLDPWHLQILTDEASPVNLNEDLGVELLKEKTAKALETLKAQYKERKIKREPFLFIKNNSGTYGMGITVVHSLADLENMNRRTKNKMSVGKNRSQIHSLAIQEGIPTLLKVDGITAEPVIYLVGFNLLGGFLRANSLKDNEENLNSEGMVFKMLCMSDLQGLAKASFEISEEADEPFEGKDKMLEIAYGAVARISALATGYEIRENGLR